MPTLLAVTPNPSVDRLWHIPGFAAGGSFRVREAWLGAGGKGCNVARVAAQLGRLDRPELRVMATGFLAGSAGDFVERDLRRSGVEPAFARLAEGETRTCPTIVDPATGEVTEILEAGPAVSEAEALAFERCFTGLLVSLTAKGPGLPGGEPPAGERGGPPAERPAAGGPVVITLSGSLPPGAPPDLYQRLIREAGELEVPAVLDASGIPLRLGCQASPWAVKVNERELWGFWDGLGVKPPLEPGAEPGETELIETLVWVAGRSLSLSVVTRGARGLLAYDGHDVWRGLPPRDLRVIQPVGSGDAATAALARGLANLLHRGELRGPSFLLGRLDAARRAAIVRELIIDMVAAGAANVVTGGIGNAPPEVFTAMRSRVTVERVGG